MAAKRSTKSSVSDAFGAELRDARIEAKLTQQVLAERAEVDPVFVSFLENGHPQPSLTVMLSIERVLGLTPGELAQRTSRRLGHDVESKRKPTGTRSTKMAGARRQRATDTTK